MKGLLGVGRIGALGCSILAMLVFGLCRPAFAEEPPTTGSESGPTGKVIPVSTPVPEVFEIVDIGHGERKPKASTGEKGDSERSVRLDREELRQDLRELREARRERAEERRERRRQDRRTLREDRRDARLEHRGAR